MCEERKSEKERCVSEGEPMSLYHTACATPILKDVTSDHPRTKIVSQTTSTYSTSFSFLCSAKSRSLLLIRFGLLPVGSSL